jgi:hypothetical protein
MRNILKSLLLMFAMATFAVGCNNSDKDATAMLEILPVDTTASSITFVINVEADECAYMLYDGDNISVDTVLSEGTATDGGVITIKDLQPKTKYYVVAAARSGKIIIMKPLMMETKESNGGGGNDDNNDDPFELPDIDGVENIVIEKTKDGRWYEVSNYYVTFVRDNGDRIILDFYTLDETMSSYFPYGQYTFATNYHPYTIHPETSGYVPAGKSADGEGYNFTDGYVTVDVVNGQYAIYMLLTYVEDGTSKSIQAYYNGPLSGASVPKGDDNGSEELIEVLEVGSTSFQFRINAEEGQYWRCSVVDKHVYDHYQSNPGAWVVTYGFMLDGTRTFNWENGKECEHVPGLIMEAMSSTDYIILAALMDYSDGQENSLLGGVEIVQVRTEEPAAGTGSVDINIKEINSNNVTFDCIFGENVWCCYVAMLPTQRIEEIKSGEYAQVGFSSYEECMIAFIPALSHDSKRQFMATTYDYKWEYLNYNTSYTMCVLVEDMNKGVTFFEVEPFTTK